MDDQLFCFDEIGTSLIFHRHHFYPSLSVIVNDERYFHFCLLGFLSVLDIPTFYIVIMSSLDPPAGHTRPIVFFDVSIGDTPAGRIKMGKS